MAMTKCKECKAKISTKADKCPNCGAPSKTEVSAGMGCLIIIVAVVVIGAIFGGSGGGGSSGSSSSNWRTQDNSSMAYIMMEDFVKKRLQSPSTADFPGVFDGRGDHTKKLSDHTYSISSYVDAQNGFGATIRTRFSGEIKQTSENEWQLQSLKLLQ